MKAAQGLHDEGLISYHRTDSTTLSQKALGEAGKAITRHLRRRSSTPAPRQYQTKVRNAQEAHEAIRPTDFDRRPQQLSAGLDADEARIYDLIWKRAIASQMADARLLRTTDRDHRPRDRLKATPCSPPRARRSSSPASCAPTSKAATIRPRRSTIRRRSCRRCARGQSVTAPGAGQAGGATLGAARSEGARDHAAGALHRRLAGQAARGRGHRPAVDLRLDHQDHPAAAATCSARARR